MKMTRDENPDGVSAAKNRLTSVAANPSTYCDGEGDA
jgi:hypothetical protein